ncbi:glycosyltransferase [Inquilinus limosus]|uniref:glycosyltransferase n=1 Tax=Inquilinus limosus TaxID=171674 RepID=UPI000479F9BE|nr:glycosyltransferase [Inquilinus limosus]
MISGSASPADGRIPDIPLRVAVICPIVVQHDAISAAAVDTYRALANDPRFDVVLLTWCNDFPEIKARIVQGGVADMLLDPAFLRADMLVYHFGIYAELIDALLVGNGHAIQAVYFHNITPAAIVPAADRPVIERSFRQMSNLAHADEVWPVSPVNAQELIDRDFDQSRLHIIPLSVEGPRLLDLEGKPAKPIEILFVGRLVPSKGVLDLVRGMARIRQRLRVPVRIRIVGNERFSDRAYIAAVRAEIAALEGDLSVELLGTVDDQRLHDLYLSSHVFAIPSYHEGFCKTVVEALRAGCIPVGYAAHNLPNVVGGLGRLTAAGDIDALGEAMLDVVNGTAAALDAPEQPHLHLDRGRMSLREFDREAKRHVDAFTFRRFAETTCERILALCQGRRRRALKPAASSLIIESAS